MKLKRNVVLPGGTIVPKGTDLTFTDGCADFNGEKVYLGQLPASACEYELNKELNPDIWDGDKLKQDVAERLLSIAQDFYSQSGFTAPIQDIILTGSMANYNYHDQSDIDVHIVINYVDEDENVELVRNAATAIKWKWNMQHNITIAGHEVEVYIQDASEPHTASGVYSLMKSEWLVKPSYRTINVSDEDIQFKVAEICNQCDQLYARYEMAETTEDMEQVLQDIDELRYKALHLRKDAFAEGQDEFSVGNMAFKALRNDGTIERLLNLETKIYDKLHSINGDEDDDILQKYIDNPNTDGFAELYAKLSTGSKALAAAILGIDIKEVDTALAKMKQALDRVTAGK